MDDVEISRLVEGTPISYGAHSRREDGMCAVELVAYIAGEPHSYEPACASELLTGYTIRINDHMRPSERRSLKPFLPRMVGTRLGDEYLRFELMARLAVTSLFAPALERRGATALASQLRQRTRMPLGEFALWLRGLSKFDFNVRLGATKFQDVRSAFGHALDAAERARDGGQPNWNWCGGELGLAVSDASRFADDADWAVALKILEAGIDAATENRPATGVNARAPGFRDPGPKLKLPTPI